MTDPAAVSRPSASRDPFSRYEARVLDPATAVRLPGGPAPATTIYRGDALLVTASSRAEAEVVIAEIVRLAPTHELRRVGPDVFEEIDEDRDGEQGNERGNDRPDMQAHNRLARLLALAEQTGTPLVVPIRFGSSLEGPAPAVDVWPLLQAVRNTLTDELVRQVGLDHLMFSAASINGDPFGPKGLAVIGGDPFGPKGLSVGVNSYGSPGWGGHGPVSVVLAAPCRSPGGPCPHVVVLDTGVGHHPWFDVEPVDRQITLAGGELVGMDVNHPQVRSTDPEGRGADPDPLTGLLATHAGHGTFITGLLRQTCPDARISSLRVMDGDGVVTECELAVSLMALGTWLVESPGSVDALVLSLGYYCEQPDDTSYTAALEWMLLTLSARGVVTFAAAGNDCSSRRSYPAAFADHPGFGPPTGLPLVAVAALNPDGSVALFSNDASWVNGEAPGANVVSTSPVHASGAWTADTALIGPGGRRRGTIDPDSFRGGFATWSGTSFAAPVLAGRYLANLVAAGCPDDLFERTALVPPRLPPRPATGAKSQS